MNRASSGDQVKDFLRKGDNQPACQCQEALRTLRRVMALEGKTHLYKHPSLTESDRWRGSTKNEGGEIIYDRQRITGSKGSCRKAAEAQQSRRYRRKTKTSLSAERKSAMELVVILGDFLKSKK